MLASPDLNEWLQQHVSVCRCVHCSRVYLVVCVYVHAAGPACVAFRRRGQQTPPLFCACCSLATIRRNATAQNFAIAPSAIVDNIEFISSSIVIGRQEDAHEFLAHLLDSMERHCTRSHLPLCNLLVSIPWPPTAFLRACLFPDSVALALCARRKDSWSAGSRVGCAAR